MVKIAGDLCARRLAKSKEGNLNECGSRDWLLRDKE